MAESRLCVVKVGGSLIADLSRLKSLLERLADGAEGPVAIVPGGGPFADAVRVAQVALAFGDGLAHRLALDAMGHMAEVFQEIEPRLMLVPEVATIGDALAERPAVVWTAADLLGGHPSISENWEVTSDSLAIWLATSLGAAQCILVKSSPCPSDAEPAALAREGFVDAAFPGFAQAFAGDIVVWAPGGKREIFRPHPDPEDRNVAA